MSVVPGGARAEASKRYQASAKTPRCEPIANGNAPPCVGKLPTSKYVLSPIACSGGRCQTTLVQTTNLAPFPIAATSRTTRGGGWFLLRDQGPSSFKEARRLSATTLTAPAAHSMASTAPTPRRACQDALTPERRIRQAYRVRLLNHGRQSRRDRPSSGRAPQTVTPCCLITVGATPR
jgi:hypothetical protein